MVKDVELWPQRPGFDSRPGQNIFSPKFLVLVVLFFVRLRDTRPERFV